MKYKLGRLPGFVIVCLVLLTNSFLPVAARSAEVGQADMPSGSVRSALPIIEDDPDVTIVYHPLTGKVRFMGAPDQSAIPQPTALQLDDSGEGAARSFLAFYGEMFGIRDSNQDLRLMRETTPEGGGTNVRFQQIYQGVPVLAGEIIVSMDASKNVRSVAGEILPDIDLSLTPLIDAQTARRNALASVAKTSGMDASELVVSEPELWIYNPALLTPHKGETVLTWRMEVTSIELAPLRQLVLVGAARGNVVLSFNQVDTARNRATYTANNLAILPGSLVCNETNSSCTGGDAHAVNAHVYAGQTYDFYFNNHGRDSIDNAGMALISTVHYESGYDNAFWNGSQMVYGDAYGFPNADDVVAHELTHGVTEHESGLFYYYQSGAINESFSDVWGEFVDQTNGAGTDTPAVKWLMGEDVTGLGALRNMSNPPFYGDPDKMTSANYYTGELDNGGVHFNSGINNKAAYLMVDGGSFNGYTVTGIGLTKAAKIYYYAQTNMITSGADYGDLYYALIYACNGLVGTSGITSANCQEVADAVNAVEMSAQPVAGFNTDAPMCSTSGKFPAYAFHDDLESGAAKWASGFFVGEDRWSYGSPWGPYAHSGTGFLYADDFPAQIIDTYIRMATPVTVPPNGKLHFYHAYGFENTLWDGGVLEYSLNNGSSWNDAGALMDYNGYDGTLSNASGNPLGGRTAFANDSHGYISTRLNLASFAGQSILFRWRMGLDNFEYDWGWWLDDVGIYECVRFYDVPSSHWAYSWIDTLAGNGITSGCAAGYYCPENSVTRAEMAVFLLRGMHGSTYNPPSPIGTVFADVPLGYWAAKWIERLAAEGITSGCSAANYCPDSTVTRAEMAVFLLRAKHGPSYTPPAATGVFTDVPTSYWAAKWIERLAVEGITTGCGTNTYCPDSPVTRAQMAVFLTRTFNLPAVP